METLHGSRRDEGCPGPSADASLKSEAFHGLDGGVAGSLTSGGWLQQILLLVLKLL
jgi:hypothetical protein